mmetsp:Transcript_23240/g.58730  ORF Transcript_23240/g.58730 Transcript_23240/m.58730 type:complete len:225 (+) Transcript_23240:2408-3082(+)
MLRAEVHARPARRTRAARAHRRARDRGAATGNVFALRVPAGPHLRKSGLGDRERGPLRVLRHGRRAGDQNVEGGENLGRGDGAGGGAREPLQERILPLARDEAGRGGGHHKQRLPLRPVRLERGNAVRAGTLFRRVPVEVGRVYGTRSEFGPPPANPVQGGAGERELHGRAASERGPAGEELHPGGVRLGAGRSGEVPEHLSRDDRLRQRPGVPRIHRLVQKTN